jgi:hypothetical protein
MLLCFQNNEFDISLQRSAVYTIFTNRKLQLTITLNYSNQKYFG